MAFMLVETFPTSLFSVLYCFIGSMAAVQAYGVTALLEASPDMIPWSRPSKNEQPSLRLFLLGGRGCCVNCTQIF